MDFAGYTLLVFYIWTDAWIERYLAGSHLPLVKSPNPYVRRGINSTLDSNTSLSLIKMASSVKRKLTQPPVDLDTNDGTSTKARESKRGRYDTAMRGSGGIYVS